MMLSHRYVPRLTSVLSAWACVGVFVLLAGLALVEDGSRYATQVNLLLFLPAVLLVVLASDWSALRRQPATWLVLALLGWVVGSVLLNPGGEINQGRWLKICLQILVFLLLIPILQRKDHWLDRALLCAVIVAMLCAWLSLYQNYWVLDYPLAYREHRLESSGLTGLADFGNPILAALFYAAMALLALVLWPRIGKAWKLLWLLGLCGLGLAVFLTYARGVWVALGLGAVAYWGLTLSRRHFLLLLGGLGTCFLLAVCVAPATMAKVFLNLTYREEIWYYTLERLDVSWLFGLGPEAPFNACVAALKRCFNQAHSLYLQLLFEFGALGVLLLIWLLAALVLSARGRRTHPHVRLALPLLVFALVAGFASFHALFTRPGLVWMFFWLPVAMLLVGGSARRQGGAA